jgi:hypothetical protein
MKQIIKREGVVRCQHLIGLALITMVFISAGSNSARRSYYFDEKGIAREVLENYLDKSITMAFFLVPEKPEGKRVYPYHADDLRMIQNIGAKFIGRAIYRWGEESLLNDPNFWKKASTIIDTLHRTDPDIIFQGCLFEIITEDVDHVKIPSWVLKIISYPSTTVIFHIDPCSTKMGKAWTIGEREVAYRTSAARKHNCGSITWPHPTSTSAARLFTWDKWN